MALFYVGSTVICSIEITKDGALYSPATSTNITIDQSSPLARNVITSTAMTPDSTGKFHYDFDSTGQSRGVYLATYIATDGARITIERKTFNLE